MKQSTKEIINEFVTEFTKTNKYNKRNQLVGDLEKKLIDRSEELQIIIRNNLLDEIKRDLPQKGWGFCTFGEIRKYLDTLYYKNPNEIVTIIDTALDTLTDEELKI